MGLSARTELVKNKRFLTLSLKVVSFCFLTFFLLINNVGKAFTDISTEDWTKYQDEVVY